MRLDRRAVVRPDVDVDAEHLAAGHARVERPARGDGIAAIQQCQHGRAENQRAAMGDARLDDEVRAARDQISSCIATMSCGYWMIGRPSHAKL